MSENNINKFKSAFGDSTSKYQQWWIFGSAVAAFVIAVVIAVAVVGAPIFSAFSGLGGGLTSVPGADVKVPSLTVPSLGAADPSAEKDPTTGSDLVLSEAQKAEGYELSSDGLVAWRYYTDSEVSGLTCGGGEDFNDPCAVRHVLAIGSGSCGYIDVYWSGESMPNSIEPGKNGAPVQFDSANSASDTVAKVACEKSSK